MREGAAAHANSSVLKDHDSYGLPHPDSVTLSEVRSHKVPRGAAESVKQGAERSWLGDGVEL